MSFEQMIAEAFCPEYITQIVSILKMVETEGLKRSKIKWKSNTTGLSYYNFPEVIYS